MVSQYGHPLAQTHSPLPTIPLTKRDSKEFHNTQELSIEMITYPPNQLPQCLTEEELELPSFMMIGSPSLVLKSELVVGPRVQDSKKSSVL